MAKLLILFAVAAFLQLAYGRPSEEALRPQTFADFTKQAETAFGTLHSKFLEFVGVSNQEELTTLVQNQGREYASKIQDLVKQLGSEVKNNAEKADDIVKNLQEKLTSTANELRQSNPEFFTNADKFQESLKNVISETEKYNEKLQADGKVISSEMEAVLKQIYDSTVQTAQKVATEIETIVKEKKH